MPGARGDCVFEGARLGHCVGDGEGHALEGAQRFPDVQQHHAGDRQQADLQISRKV